MSWFLEWYGWISAKLQYLQCISSEYTAVLHQTNDMILMDNIKVASKYI